MKKICREQYGRQGNNRTTWWEDPLEKCEELLDKWVFKDKDSNTHTPTRLSSISRPQPSLSVETKAQPLEPDKFKSFSMTYGCNVVAGGLVINVRKFYDKHEISRASDRKMPSHRIQRYTLSISPSLLSTSRRREPPGESRPLTKRRLWTTRSISGST